MKLRSIIVEDNFIARRTLENLCSNHDSINHLESFESVEEALLFLDSVEVDIIWLDVEMKGLTGFDLVKRLPVLPSIIMTTSSTEYAFEAYQSDILDYIQKPISLPRFRTAVAKVLAQDKFNTKKAETTQKDNIFIKVDKKYIRLSISDIVYVENLSDYVKIVTHSNVYIVYITMKSLDEKLGDQFFRVHRSYLVNLGKIKDVDENNLVVEGKVIPISRRIRTEFLEKLNIL